MTKIISNGINFRILVPEFYGCKIEIAPSKMISINYGLPTKKPIHVKRLSYITRGNTQFDIQIENFLRNSSHSVLYIKNALVEVMQQVCNLDNVYLSSNPIYFLGFVGLQISLFTYKTLVK